MEVADFTGCARYKKIEDRTGFPRSGPIECRLVTAAGLNPVRPTESNRRLAGLLSAPTRPPMSYSLYAPGVLRVDPAPSIYAFNDIAIRAGLLTISPRH